MHKIYWANLQNTVKVHIWRSSATQRHRRNWIQQNRQCTYNLQLRGFSATMGAVESSKFIYSEFVCVCLCVCVWCFCVCFCVVRVCVVFVCVCIFVCGVCVCVCMCVCVCSLTHPKSNSHAIFSSVASPALPQFSTLSHKRYDFRRKKFIVHKLFVWFL